MIQSKRINGIDVNYAIANPQVDDIYAAFKIGATVKELGIAGKADAAMTVNFAHNDKGVPIGRLIADGKEVISDEPKTAPRDEIYMLPDKTLHMGKAPKGSIWSVQGSPPLLRDGKDVIDEGIKKDQTGNDIWTKNSYRNAGGITSDGRYVGVRTLSTVSLKTLRGIMEALGCRYALNFDGGGSACMWPADSASGRLMGASLNIKWGGAREVFKLIGDQKPELVIDPGHGGADPGASNGNIIEKHITLQAALYIYNRMKTLGVKVALTRDTDKTLTNDQRTAMIKDSGTKHCISCHINAGGGDGAEVIHSIYSNGRLARLIASEIVAAGQNLRRVFTRTLDDPKKDYYFMHRNTGNVETNIVEFFFLDSKASGPDADLNEYEREQKDWWEAVVRAYCTHMEHRYTPPAVEPSKSVGNTSFKDVPAGHYSIGAIEWAKSIGLVNGYPDGTLGFGENITIERLLVILNRLKN